MSVDVGWQVRKTTLNGGAGQTHLKGMQYGVKLVVWSTTVARGKCLQVFKCSETWYIWEARHGKPRLTPALAALVDQSAAYFCKKHIFIRFKYNFGQYSRGLTTSVLCKSHHSYLISQCLWGGWCAFPYSWDIFLGVCLHWFPRLTPILLSEAGLLCALHGL